MLYDNTELLRNYVHGFQSYVRKDFLATAREIVGWLDATMTDREQGGFYASQDADINLNDDGDYFTWTLDEARAVLSAEELEFASSYWDIGELGDMNHTPRNVLHVKQSLEEMAAQGADLEALTALRDTARRKLLAARSQRPTPFIDRTLYTGWNAMAVSAYLETARVLRLEDVEEFALKTLNRLLNDAWDRDQGLFHVMAYGEAQPSVERVPGTLDDYAFTIHAAVDAWETTGNVNFYRVAVKLADAMIAKFYDRTSGAFCDTATAPQEPAAAGSARCAPEAVAGLAHAGRKSYCRRRLAAPRRLKRAGGIRTIAEETLASFAAWWSTLGSTAGSYGLASKRLLLDPVQVVIVGSGADAWRLVATAVARFSVNKSVMRIPAARVIAGKLPEALDEVLPHVPAPQGASAWALVCKGRTCLPPITGAEALLEALERPLP